MKATICRILSSILVVLCLSLTSDQKASAFDEAAGPGYDAAPGMDAAASQVNGGGASPVKDGMFKIPNFMGDSRLDNHYGWSEDCKCYKKQKLPSQAPASANSGGFTAPALSASSTAGLEQQTGTPAFIRGGRPSGQVGNTFLQMGSSAVPGFGGPASQTPQYHGASYGNGGDFARRQYPQNMRFPGH